VKTEITRAIDAGPHSLKSRVEPLHMSHLKDTAQAFGPACHRFCIGEVRGEGLFHENVKACCHEIVGDRVVQTRRSSDNRGCSIRQHILIVSRPSKLKLFCKRLPALALGVHDGHERKL
jgi:hypothetical protein